MIYCLWFVVITILFLNYGFRASMLLVQKAGGLVMGIWP